MEVNHQYSKSFEFEQALHAYVTNYIDPHIRLFSLLRPHYEMQIVREFIHILSIFLTLFLVIED